MGARWRRWEPHIHSPGTALNDGFGATTLDQYLDAVEAAVPTVEALGVTDYLLTRKYEEVRTAKDVVGRLPDVALIFCNIEVRLTIETRSGSGVNLHLLVCPDDPDHVEQVRRFLSGLAFHFAGDNYSCTEDDLRRLGRAHDPSIVDDEAALKAGVNQFKVDFHGLRKRYEETDWARANILIAVAGSSNDGTAGLQDEGASFASTRKEIERFAHIIFTATPKNIDFWCGEGVLDADELEMKYGGMKPCLHGSDAHKRSDICAPDESRFTWIKGDPTFDALKQACMEPAHRVHIGSAAPVVGTAYSVASVSTPGLPWLVPQPVPINPGMVAIIGSRGSGKTAMADLIAHAGASPWPTAGQQSFLSRANELLGSQEVRATWNGASDSVHRFDVRPDALPEVHYLTQQFVDRLCSSVSQSDELLDEIKRVVFLAHEPANRLGADGFDELVRLRSSDTQLAVEALNQRLDRLSQEVSEERAWFQRRPQLQRDVAKAKGDLAQLDKARQELIKPGGKERADYYNKLGAAISEREQQLQSLQRTLAALTRLQAETQRYANEVFPQLVVDLQRIHSEAGLGASDWESFFPSFTGDPLKMLSERIEQQTQAIATATASKGTQPAPELTQERLADCGLAALKTAFAAVGALIGADQKNVQRLKQLSDSRATMETRQRRLEEELKRAEASETRLKGLLQERSSLYGRFFELVIEQVAILQDLYAPLEALLATSGTSAEKLSLRVVRSVNVASWAKDGEDRLLDLRKNGTFRGRGALAEVANQHLLPAWRDGTASDVVTAMEAFRAAHDDSLLSQSAVDRNVPDYQQWIVDLGRWLYSTEHVRVEYEIEYEGVPITQLSPGTRGIVLLLLYLALDLEDARPLLIDQPEENLDPKSVFKELVQLFRQARVRRQVIIVTHNANLVVNTDVDQVIIASCVKTGGGAPPEFHYQSGGLEDPDIRRQVCEILEGGEAAFKQRARRLRVSI